MSQDILQQTAPRKALEPKSNKAKISVLGVILAIILAFVLVLLGERIIFDLNRTANPLVDEQIITTGSASPSRAGIAYEKSMISNQKIGYPTVDKDKYMMFKLIIHSAFIIPIFLLTFLLYYQFNIKRKNSHYRVVMWAYIVFAIWMILHLLGETAKYIVQKYENAAIYIILGVLAIAFTLLAVFIQKKVAEKHERELS